MVTIKDIARVSGYSKTTVSKAFNNYTDISDKARDDILKIADEMGYIPNAQARGLTMKRSFSIGVILDEILGLGLSHPFFSQVIQSFREVVEEKGYSMILVSNKIGNTKIESYLSHCNQRNVDAVFILCTNKDDPGIQELIHSKIPTVLFDIDDEDTSCVLTDHYQAARMATEYLIGLGHERIGHIYGNELTVAGRLRKQGFYDAMAENELFVEEGHVVSGGFFDFKYGKQAMESIIDSDSMPTAVFIAGDIMALGAIQACHERGIRVPEDLSIIGFDNLNMLEWITPALTTVAQNYNAIASNCCDILDDIVQNKTLESTKVTIPGYIVERRSCKRID